MLFGVRASWMVIDSKPRPQKDLKRTVAKSWSHSSASETHSNDRAMKNKKGYNQSTLGFFSA